MAQTAPAPQAQPEAPKAGQQNQYVEMVLKEHFEGGKAMANGTRTLAFQVSEELLMRIKDHLKKTGMSQKDFVIRLKDEKETEVFPYLARIKKSLKEQGFSVKRADKEDIKRLLAVYYEQNVTTEKFEDFDGERWIIPDD